MLLLGWALIGVAAAIIFEMDPELRRFVECL
jgi:hypothetical protein